MHCITVHRAHRAWQPTVAIESELRRDQHLSHRAVRVEVVRNVPSSLMSVQRRGRAGQRGLATTAYRERSAKTPDVSQSVKPPTGLVRSGQVADLDGVQAFKKPCRLTSVACRSIRRVRAVSPRRDGGTCRARHVASVRHCRWSPVRARELELTLSRLFGRTRW